VAILPDAKDLATCTQVPRGRVVQRVLLKRTRGYQLKTKLRKAVLKGFWIGDGELEFDFGSLHGWKYKT
jgi:hypothetical protein